MARTRKNITEDPDSNTHDGSTSEADPNDSTPDDTETDANAEPEIDTDAEIERLMGASMGAPVAEPSDDEFSVEGLDEVDSKFEVPDGTYGGKCVEIKNEISKKSGFPMIVFTYVLTDGGKHAGKEFIVYATKKPTALFTMKMVLKAYGIDTDRPQLTFSKQQVLHVPVRLTMKAEKYMADDGEERSSSKIKKVAPANA